MMFIKKFAENIHIYMIQFIAGYATLGGWNSVYRNNYCLDLHTVIHEIGHNLGLNHGNQQVNLICET